MQTILTHQEISHKIERLAHEVIENTYTEKELFIVGIAGNGFLVAKRLADVISRHSTQIVKVVEIKVNKTNPLSERISLSLEEDQLENGCIILVDDVLNSGKTMQYALMKLLERPTRLIKTVALVDRTHRRYPIKADFVGLILSTTLQDRVEITETNDQFTANLV